MTYFKKRYGEHYSKDNLSQNPYHPQRTIFVCFASRDNALAIKITEELCRRNFTASFTQSRSKTMITGQYRRIKYAYAVIVLFTDEALSCPKLKNELLLADHNNKNIIVLKYTKANFNSQQKTIFANATVIDATTIPPNDVFEKLCREIEALRHASAYSYSQRQAVTTEILQKISVISTIEFGDLPTEGTLSSEEKRKRLLRTVVAGSIGSPAGSRSESPFGASGSLELSKPSKPKNTQLSLYAPARLVCGADMLVQVFLHGEDSTEAVAKKAQMKDSKAALRGNESLDLLLDPDDEIEVKLLMPKGVMVDTPVQKVRWKNDLKSVDFVVSVPKTYQLGDMIGTAIICKDSLPLCSIKFVTKVVSQIKAKAPKAKTYPKFYEKVFVSYSSRDRKKVMNIAKVFKMLHIDFFLDKLYLEGGDKYKDKIFDYINKADLFLLCWSSNAEKSEWVEKEYTYALQRNSHPKTMLTIYPVHIKPKADPPEALKDLNFVEFEEC